jgi:hypothetical protein
MTSAPEPEKKRSAYGLIGTVIVVILVLLVLGWLFR